MTLKCTSRRRPWLSTRSTNRTRKVAGWGSEIASFITEQAFDDLDAPVGRITGANAPTPYTKNLERLNSPTPEKIAAAVRRGYINSLMSACAMSEATPSGRCASGPPSPRTGSS